MKKIFIITALALALVGFTGATFAKSRSSSSKSSSSSKKSSSNTSTKSSKPNTAQSAKPDASKNAKPGTAKKQTADTDDDKDKQSKARKNTKTHRCRLPDGSINYDASRELCLKVGGQWVKY